MKGTITAPAETFVKLLSRVYTHNGRIDSHEYGDAMTNTPIERRPHVPNEGLKAALQSDAGCR